MENGIGSDQIINQTNQNEAERDGEQSSGQGVANTGGHIPVVLSVPRNYQGSLTLQDSGDHRFLRAEDLRVSVNANVSWMRRNQILALLKNAGIFQLSFSELPDFTQTCRRPVITIATEALGEVAMTTEYSSTLKILKERGPRKLKIAGVIIDCHEVKGDRWGRRRYTIDGRVHVLEWTAKRIPQEGQGQRTVRTRSTSYARLVESNESVIESNARLMESNASVVASSASLVASNERLETAMTLLLECGRDLIDRLVGLNRTDLCRIKRNRTVQNIHGTI
ncbi:uncharacterized protein LOC106865992 [Brachypodium distachyon]|nr:uncharacterized protein LOC106865992 [Brachypodium distachyon]|eukprot:XP_014753889.1 uncharacterized protein LOC106865992 [Brachypodium distachyon]